MEYFAQGLLDKEAADRMGISYALVHKIQHKIFVKLHVSNRTEAISRPGMAHREWAHREWGHIATFNI